MKVILLTGVALLGVLTSHATGQSFMKMEVNITNFEQFKWYFGKTYDSPEEEAIREQNFYRTLKYVWANDQKHHGVKLRINPLADLSDEEFAAMNRAQVPKNVKASVATSEQQQEQQQEYGALPAEFDWRHKVPVNAVEQQGSCGSCWAFASSFAVETLYQIHRKVTKHLSKQQLVDCSNNAHDSHYQNHGCGFGFHQEAYHYIKDHGLVEASVYPYTGNGDQVCREGNITSTVARFKIDDFKSVFSASDEVVQQALLTTPVTVILSATHPLFRNYHGGILRNLMQNTAEVDHVMAVVGWGTENGVDYWVLRNSWGPHWGESGYVRVERHHNNLSFNYWVSWPVLQS